MKNALDDIMSFSNFPGQRLNLDKCEIAGIGVPKNLNVVHKGTKNISLTKESIKFLVVHILITRKLKMT